MKMLIALVVTLFAVDASADALSCTAWFSEAVAGENFKVQRCGVVSAQRLADNNIKYRRQTPSCKKLTVEFMSIHKNRDRAHGALCDRASTRKCYVVRIRDNASREGLGKLSAHISFPSASEVPASFSLSATGIGHKRRTMKKGPGKLVRIDASCRKTS